MKLISSKRNKQGIPLVCEDAIFDPSLMTQVVIDAAENYIVFLYDFCENGHPLNLPFDADEVQFGVTITQHDIHICIAAEPTDAGYADFEDYVNEIGDIEFDVRMNADEKFQLLRALSLKMIGEVAKATKTR